MILWALVVFMALFIGSLGGLVMLHRHIESRPPRRVAHAGIHDAGILDPHLRPTQAAKAAGK